MTNDVAPRHARLPLVHLGQQQHPTGRFARQCQRERHGFNSLPIDEGCMFPLTTLPAHHRDPFDRIIVAQALQHQLVIVTVDEDFRPTRFPFSSGIRRPVRSVRSRSCSRGDALRCARGQQPSGALSAGMEGFRAEEIVRSQRLSLQRRALSTVLSSIPSAIAIRRRLSPS